MGRPTDLTPEVQEKIVKALRAGNHFSTACEYAGIAVGTGREWLARGQGADWTTQKGRSPLPIYAEFADAIKKAMADAEAGALQRIMKAALGGEEVKTKEIIRPDGSKVTERTVSQPEWTAAAWYLERKHPDKWGRKDEVRVAAKVQEEIDAALEQLREGLPADEYERVLSILAPGERREETA